MCTHIEKAVSVALLVGMCLSLTVSLQADTLVLQQETFFDVDIQGAKVPSHTILVPKGWTAEGKAYWANPKFFNNEPSRDITLKSDDGVGLNLGPVLNLIDCQLSQLAIDRGITRKAEFDEDAGRIVLYRPDSADAWQSFYEEKIIPSLGSEITEAKVKKVFEVPELADQLRRQLQPLEQQIAESNRTFPTLNFQQGCEASAFGIRTTYQENGREMESLLLVATTNVYTDTEWGRHSDWNIVLSLSLFAPKGELEKNLPTLMTLANSVREVPNWTAMKLDHFAKMNQIAMDGFRERSRIISETHREISRIQTETYQSRSASNERIHNRFIDAIREVEYYSQGGYRYELPSGYRHVYGDANGNFILTDDANFNPNVDLDTHRNWTLVQPVPR